MSKPAIYAASRASIAECGAMWRRCRDRGARIVSTWIDEDGPGQTLSMADLWERIIGEVQSADVLVLYADRGDFPLKGAFVEAGIALAHGIPVRLVLPGLSDDDVNRLVGSWTQHPLVSVWESVEDAISVRVGISRRRHFRAYGLQRRGCVMPKRIQRKRTLGWRMPPRSVSVTRPGPFGNPFRVSHWEFRMDDVSPYWSVILPSMKVVCRATTKAAATAKALRAFRLYARLRVRRDPEWLAALRGRDLACWCPLDSPCHADVLLELANA